MCPLEGHLSARRGYRRNGPRAAEFPDIKAVSTALALGVHSVQVRVESARRIGCIAKSFELRMVSITARLIG
ncbi:MAG TPA: hypothetical protein VJR92_09355 [Gemmatimonadaceae bacterium]|nr:hypothetical protein [Gemmatimonadaceae bacterium]